MLNIRQLSKLLGISPQTIRKYEEQGIFAAERSQANYREFDRKGITTLMKCRKLMAMGFSVKQIVEIARGVSYKDGQAMLKRQADELEKEIRMLMNKRRGIAHVYSVMQEIRRKQGSCEFGMAPEAYCYPVVRNDELLIRQDEDALDQWNEFACLRHDVKRFSKEALMEGRRDGGYTGEYCIRAEDVERLGLDVSRAYHVPSHLCVRAYAVRPANTKESVQEIFGFAADFIRENHLRIVMDPVVFLPFWPHEGECEDYLVMVVHVERPGDANDLSA